MISRRSILGGLAASAVPVVTTHANAGLSVNDPLLDAISAYRAGMAAYSAREEFSTFEEEDAAIAETYGPPFKVLDDWDQPAQSLSAVREALRLVVDEQLLASGMSEGLVIAALAYLDQTGGEA